MLITVYRKLRQPQNTPCGECDLTEANIHATVYMTAIVLTRYTHAYYGMDPLLNVLPHLTHWLFIVMLQQEKGQKPGLLCGTNQPLNTATTEKIMHATRARSASKESTAKSKLSFTGYLCAQSGKARNLSKSANALYTNTICGALDKDKPIPVSITPKEHW